MISEIEPSNLMIHKQVCDVFHVHVVGAGVWVSEGLSLVWLEIIDTKFEMVQVDHFNQHLCSLAYYCNFWRILISASRLFLKFSGLLRFFPLLRTRNLKQFLGEIETWITQTTNLKQKQLRSFSEPAKFFGFRHFELFFYRSRHRQISGR